MSDKQRYARVIALRVAKELCEALKPACDRLILAGSLRRKKADVGDIEILYIPKKQWRAKQDFFDQQECNLADEVIERLLRECVLEKRVNVKGKTMFGPLNKLVRHKETGLPVDLFAANVGNWFNNLVCRTGPAASNVRICEAAIKLGARWDPYGPGFVVNGLVEPMPTEEAVFNFVGLPYNAPCERR